MNTMLWLVAAAYVGGSVLAPSLFAPGVGVHGPALLVACTTAAAAVYASDAIYERYGA
jgi:hypothetical protein